MNQSSSNRSLKTLAEEASPPTVVGLLVDRDRKRKGREPDSLAVSTTLPAGLAKRFSHYCQTTERSGSGALRLFVRRMLDLEDF